MCPRLGTSCLDGALYKVIVNMVTKTCGMLFAIYGCYSGLAYLAKDILLSTDSEMAFSANCDQLIYASFKYFVAGASLPLCLCEICCWQSGVRHLLIYIKNTLRTITI